MFPNIAMSLVTDVFVTLENRGIGANSKVYNEVVNNFTIWIAFRAFIIDFILLFLIGLYLDNVLPK